MNQRARIARRTANRRCLSFLLVFFMLFSLFATDLAVAGAVYADDKAVSEETEPAEAEAQPGDAVEADAEGEEETPPPEEGEAAPGETPDEDELPAEEAVTEEEPEEAAEPNRVQAEEAAEEEIAEGQPEAEEGEANGEPDEPETDADVPTILNVEVPEDEAATEAFESEVTAEDESGANEIRAGPAKAGGKTVLTFTSDVHDRNGNPASTRLNTWIDNVYNDYGQISCMGFCGDMGDAGASESNFWTYTGAVMTTVDSKITEGKLLKACYTTGNHEYSPGNFSPNKNEWTRRYIIDGEGDEGSNYRLYCLGSESGDGTGHYSTTQIGSLTSYLNRVGNSKPIFIITHFPLHAFSWRTIGNAEQVINALNNAANNNGQKIVFIWGHNHSQGDPNYDQIFAPGDSITYASNSSKTIQFYYAAAGCMSDSENGQSASVKGKGLVITIDDSNKLSFTYLSERNTDATEGGTFTEQDPVAVTGVTINQSDVSVEVGRTIQLSVTIEPSDATNKSVTWSSSDTSIATVDSNGKVKGIGVGTTVITATSNDTTNRAVPSDSIEVEVVPRSSSEPMYVLTDTLEPDTNYIIANKNTGEAYALTNNNGSVALTTVEIDGDVIYTENENIIFTANGSGTTVTSMENNGRFLSASNSSLTLATSEPTNRTIVYGTDNKLTMRSGNSTYYIYYSTYNGGRYTASTSASSSTSPREVYLFAEVQQQVPVTSVSVSPAEATIDPRQTVQLTATVSPAEATNKKVNWSSSNTAVATVDENGRVRGVAQGTAIITAASAADGSKKGTATITVTDNVPTEPNYVITINGYALSNEKSPNTANGGTNSYTYRGLTGVPYTAGEGAADNIRWIIEATDGGYYIKDLDGNYLNATYESGNNSGHGDLSVGDTSDVWVLDAGYSFDENGEVDGSKLKSTNATATATSPKYLGYEESPANLFTVRSESNADEVTVIEVAEPVAVTGVTVAPAEETIEVRQTVQLTATVTPSDATNKNIIWSSSNTAVATVDQTGKVRGVGEGEATITATSAADSTKTATALITVNPSTVAEPTYVITVGSFALSTETTTDQLSNNNGAYIYTGLAGAAFDPAEVPDNNIRWILEETSTANGYYIKSLDGRYLNATYTAATNPSASNPTRGVLKLDDTPDIWVMDGSLDSWEVDGSMLKSTNASGTASSDKYLAYEEGSPAGSINLFTVRSEGNADETHLVEASEPVAVTGVTVAPSEATVEAGRIVQLTATVEPENATDHSVTWTSSDTSVATVDSSGWVRGVAEGTAVITATTTDGGKTATSTITVTAATFQQTYVITIDGYALSTASSSDRLENSGSGSQRYYYTGLSGVPFEAGDEASDEIRWILTETTGGYYIMSLDGRYLNATYTSNSTGGYSGDLKLDDTPDVWVLEGTLEDWEIDGSTLKSSNASSTTSSAKYMTHEEGSSSTPLNLFTVRSTGETSVLLDPTVTIETRYIETDTLQDGKEYIIAVTKGENSVYAVKKVTSGTETGNTGSVELSVVPASGTDAAYIITSDEGVAWKYASSNQYMSNTSTYLGYESGTYLPRASSQGRAITYSNGRLGIRVNNNSSRYLTCDSEGTFNTTSSSGSASTVRIFVKTKVIVSCVHTYGAPAWTWTGDDTNGYTAATATFTCSKCGDERSVNAGITTVTNEATCTTAGSTVYTATVSAADSPDGTEHNDSKTVTIAALGHDPEHHVAAAATCEEDGNIEYWTCKRCEKYFSDAECTTEIQAADTVIKATGHTAGAAVEENRVEATCTTAGSYDEVIYCEVCGKELSRTPKTIAALGHDPEHHAAAAATCEEDGNIEYWTCKRCEKYFRDAECATEIQAADTVTKATGHDWDYTGIVWKWEGSDAEGYTANATLICKTNPAHTWTKEANVDGPLNGTYFAAVTGPDGNTYVAYRTVARYTITFANDGGAVLQTVEVNYGDTPAYTGQTPVKAPDAQYTYTFAGWDKEFAPATEDTTYTATYDTTLNRYAVAFVDDDETTVLKEAVEYDYGTTVDEIAVPEEPTKEATDYVHFTFAGWTPKLAAVTGDVTYKATYTATAHVWSETTYTWAEDKKSVTATRTCTDCGREETETVTATDEVTTAPTCEGTGVKTWTSAEFENKAFAVQATTETIPALGHDFGEWKVTTAPTCTEAGEETRTCSRCGEVETRTIEALDHDLTSHDGKEATCTEDGWNAYYTCSRCDYTTYEAIAALGHDYGDWTVTKAATCTEAGEETRTCSRCDATETHKVDALGHDLTHHEAKAATCTEVGWKAYDTCSRCSYTTYEEIPALGHDWAKPTYGWAEDHSSVIATHTCKYDATHVETEMVTATGKVTTAPTCEGTGVKTWTSAAFKNEGFAVQTVTEAIPATGHKWSAWKVTRKATYTAEGTETRTCENCEETQTRSIPRLARTSLKDAAVKVGSTTYTGKAQTPAVTVTLDGKTLKEGTDYTVKYTNNTNAGTATVTVTGKGAYKDTASQTFTIAKAKVALPTAKTNLTYNTAAQTGVASGTNYTVTNGSKTDAGTYTATAKLKDTKNYNWSDGTTAAKSVKWTIAKANIKSAKVTGISDQTYDGTAKKPAPTVKMTLNKKTVTLKSGTDYTVSYKNNTNAGTATVTITGKGNYTGTVSKTFKITKEKGSFERIAGDNRFATAYAIADKYKSAKGITKLDTIIVADGQNYPDALAAAYLAKVKDAPLVLTSSAQVKMSETAAYIRKNVKAGGTVYIVGGPGSVPEDFVKMLSGYKVKRLGGANRYETNLLILKEAKVTNQEIIVVTGADFQDALSASATGLPVLLVAGNGLTENQKAYLATLKTNKYTIVGQTGVVSAGIQTDLSKYGAVSRIGGADGYARSVNIAKKYFPGYQKHINLASGENFADALAGGPLALEKTGPLILANDNTTVVEQIKTYAKAANTTQATIYGGTVWISDTTVKMILQMN